MQTSDIPDSFILTDVKEHRLMAPFLPINPRVQGTATAGVTSAFFITAFLIALAKTISSGNSWGI